MAGKRFHRRKDDLLHWSGIDPNELSCDKAVAPFDDAVQDMDVKWGNERLVGKVSPETAAKWGSAMSKLNAAIEAKNVEEVVARVGVCIRGLAAMDAEAEARGAAKADTRIIEYRGDDGFHFAICHDDDNWKAVMEANPHIKRIVSLREVAVALQACHHPTLDAVKQSFPGAQLTAVRKKTETEEFLEDDLPF